MKVIGLAGPPGSGKSAVGRELAKRPGVRWIDLDPVAWSVYRRGTEAFVRLIDRFGSDVLSDSGEIDRRRLARSAFASPGARADLDEIVHPAVSDALVERIRSEAREGAEILLVEGALLATSPHVDRHAFDAVLWLDASPSVREERLAASGRETQADRLRGIEPPPGTVRIPADAGVTEVAKRVWRAISDL